MDQKELIGRLAEGTEFLCESSEGKAFALKKASILQHAHNIKKEILRACQEEERKIRQATKQAAAMEKQAEKEAKEAAIMAIPIQKKTRKTRVPQGPQASLMAAPKECQTPIHEHQLVPSRTLTCGDGLMRSLSGCCQVCLQSNLECFRSCKLCNFDICRSCFDRR